MIDLHIHSINSDGEKNIREIFEIADKLKLKYISVTDHNTVAGYNEIENIKKDYNIGIINGCEITTTYKGTIIEILAYDFKINKMKKFINEKCLKSTKARLDYEINFLLKLADKYNMKYDKSVFEKLDYSRFSVPIFLEEICKYPENKNKFMSDAWKDGSVFFRKYILDKESEWHFDSTEYYPDLSSVINAIHEADGKAFIAHPFDYKISNIDNMLNELVSMKIDGIEVYHPSTDKKKRKFLINFASNNNLYISGGSDFHGKHEPKKLYIVGDEKLGYVVPDTILKWYIK